MARLAYESVIAQNVNPFDDRGWCIVIYSQIGCNKVHWASKLPSHSSQHCGLLNCQEIRVVSFEDNRHRPDEYFQNIRSVATLNSILAIPIQLDVPSAPRHAQEYRRQSARA